MELSKQVDAQMWEANLPSGIQLSEGTEQGKAKYPSPKGNSETSKESRNLQRMGTGTVSKGPGAQPTLNQQ